MLLSPVPGAFQLPVSSSTCLIKHTADVGLCIKKEQRKSVYQRMYRAAQFTMLDACTEEMTVTVVVINALLLRQSWKQTKARGGGPKPSAWALVWFPPTSDSAGGLSSLEHLPLKAGLVGMLRSIFLGNLLPEERGSSFFRPRGCIKYHPMGGGVAFHGWPCCPASPFCFLPC